MEDVAMIDPEDSLVTRRSRRSTAGNRMEAALAEMALDASVKEVDDDNDFVNDKDEEDMFESDFESTDEEAAQDDVEAGDNLVRDEERKARKVSRLRLEKATAAAHVKHQATFNSPVQASVPIPKPREMKNRVSGIINVDTGQVVAGGKTSPSRKKRHSQRRHTILNTSATVKRMKRSEEKKAAAPKKVKIESRSYTQAELIALALDNEEGNIVEHRDYLKIEEEKRRRARVVRATVEGPLLRWVSRGEEKKVIISPPALSAFSGIPLPQPFQPGSSYSPASSSIPYVQGTTSFPASSSTNAGSANHSTLMTSASTATMTTQFQLQPPKQSQFEATNYIPYSPQANASTTMPPAPPAEPIERIEKFARNYIVHELSQYPGVPRASWNETMSAMFGDHVKWDELRVYVGKGRPLSRPRQMCPITGKVAKYLDPRTGVPYADLRAFEVLTEILKHEYIWNPTLGCYVGREEGPSTSDGEAMTLLNTPAN